MLSTTDWFDAHLDLASLAERGRDMHTDSETCRGELQPAAVTLPSLAEGRVRACLGTIFTQAVPDPTAADAPTAAYAYPMGDAEAAEMAGKRQLKLYHAWRDAGVIELLPRRSALASSPRPRGEDRGEGSASASASDLKTQDSCLKTPPASDLKTQDPSPKTPPASDPSCLRASVPPCLSLGILIECADPIRTPDDLNWWADRGVVAIGMAWWHQSRYAGGNGVEAGLTDLGRALVTRMDELGIVHDASHLSDRSLAELFERTDAPVIASHSNCRALLRGGTALRAVSGGTGVPPAAGAPGSELSLQRHLTDEAIAEIARRGGVIGLNLVRNFIRTGLDPKDPTDRPTVDEAVAHVEHVCEIAGDRAHVGLGSDMDGGITANDLPAGIDRPRDLHRLLDALSARGWPDEDLHAFAWGNWARYWGLSESAPA